MDEVLAQGLVAVEKDVLGRSATAHCQVRLQRAHDRIGQVDGAVQHALAPAHAQSAPRQVEVLQVHILHLPTQQARLPEQVEAGPVQQRISAACAIGSHLHAPLKVVAQGTHLVAAFTYDGDGQRVKRVVGSVTTVTIGDFFEWTGSTATMKSYYYAGGARVAVRTGSSLNWIMGDHLGSTSVVTDANGTLHSKQLYKPWGEMRFSSGTLPTDYKYTGQREEAAQGLYDYKARFYDPVLGRFLQADSIVPGAGNPSAWDRYAYVLNNPTRYTDPSGHSPCFEDGFCVDGKYNAETHLSYLISLYGLAFSGKLPWSIDTMWSITKAVQTIGEKFSSILGLDPVSSFKSMYGVRWDRKFIFEMGCDECLGFGLTIGTRHIKFRDFYSDYFSNVTLGVHELGHAFENAMERTLGDGRKYKEARTTLPNHHVNNRQGLLPHWRWQHNLDPSPGEVFADTFIAFVFDKWDRSPLNINIANDRSVWMNDHMPRFIDTTMQNQGGGR